jgi:hypothetical protein
VQVATCRALGSKFARGYYGRNTIPLLASVVLTLNTSKEMFLTWQPSSLFSIIPPACSKKLKERINLVYNIKLSGIKMSPCSFCDHNGHKCVVAEQSKRYSEYACRGQKYDVKGIPAGD